MLKLHFLITVACIFVTGQAAALSPTTSTSSARPFADKLCAELNNVSGGPASLLDATPLELQLVAYMEGMRSGALSAYSSLGATGRLRGITSPAVNLAIAVKQLCRVNPILSIGQAASYIFVNGLAPE